MKNNALPDGDILAIAEEKRCIVVTMDKDFGWGTAAVAGPPGCCCSDSKTPRATEKAEVVRAILNQHADEIEGHSGVFQNGKRRVR